MAASQTSHASFILQAHFDEGAVVIYYGVPCKSVAIVWKKDLFRFLPVRARRYEVSTCIQFPYFIINCNFGRESKLCQHFKNENYLSVSRPLGDHYRTSIGLIQDLYKTSKTTIYPPEKRGITDEGTGHWVDLCSQRKQGSERSDEVPAFNLSPLTSNLKIVN